MPSTPAVITGPHPQGGWQNIVERIAGPNCHGNDLRRIPG
jgi:hypothetical protein